MKLTQARISRYLGQIKKLNDYLMKTRSKNRDAMVKLQLAESHLLAGEDLLRQLLNFVVEENIND